MWVCGCLGVGVFFCFFNVSCVFVFFFLLRFLKSLKSFKSLKRKPKTKNSTGVVQGLLLKTFSTFEKWAVQKTHYLKKGKTHK